MPLQYENLKYKVMLTRVDSIYSTKCSAFSGKTRQKEYTEPQPGTPVTEPLRMRTPTGGRDALFNVYFRIDRSEKISSCHYQVRQEYTTVKQNN